MDAFWVELLRYSPAILAGVLALVVALMGLNRKKGAVTTADTTTALSRVIEMLPSLIRLTEITNANRSGEEKKAFLMDYLKSLFSIMGGSLDESTTAYLSGLIDNTVGLTKAMHTESEVFTIEKDF